MKMTNFMFITVLPTAALRGSSRVKTGGEFFLCNTAGLQFSRFERQLKDKNAHQEFNFCQVIESS